MKKSKQTKPKGLILSHWFKQKIKSDQQMSSLISHYLYLKIDVIDDGVESIMNHKAMCS